ncbi:MAG: glycosyltransferase family 2 protein, partial [Dehalococcoidales bacterium]|nr:glycosyltransferase family 2 protein [Dehalococcoidales bacterium]
MSDKPENYPPITVLVCTLNEEKNLQYVLPKIPDWVDEVLLVDANSTDKTVEIARQMIPGIRVLMQKDKGKGNAMRYGIQQAKGEIVVMLDADGSTDPAEIQSFISPLVNGYDFAKGSRFLKTRPVMPELRQFGNKMFAILTNILYGTRYTDMCAGLNAFHKGIISKLDPDGTSFLDEPTLNIRLKKKGFKVMEVTKHDS